MKTDSADLPVAFTATRTMADMNWHFVYYYKRSIWKRMLWMLLLMAVIIIAMDTYRSGYLHFQFFTAGLTSSEILYCAGWGFFSAALGGLAMYITDYIIMIFSYMKSIKKFPNQTTEFIFDREKMFMRSEYGEGTQKYDVFRRIYLYKHLIVFEHSVKLFHIVPWRDIPVEQRDRFRGMLAAVKARLKI